MSLLCVRECTVFEAVRGIAESASTDTKMACVLFVLARSERYVTGTVLGHQLRTGVCVRACPRAYVCVRGRVRACMIACLRRVGTSAALSYTESASKLNCSTWLYRWPLELLPELADPNVCVCSGGSPTSCHVTLLSIRHQAKVTCTANRRGVSWVL